MKIKRIYVIFFLALVLRLVYFLEVRNTPVLDFLYIDSEFYHNWAARIAGGEFWGGPRIFFMAPLYAYFLGIIYFVFGAHFQIALFFQIIIGSTSCVLLYFVGRKYFDKRTAVIAGIAAAVYPVFIFYDAVLLKENLMIFLLLLFVLSYPMENSSAKPASDKRLLLLSGGLIGLNALLRPNIFLLIPFLFVFEFLRNEGRVFVKKAVIFTAGILITVFPVAMRNKIVGGEWVITVASSGMNFWTGNNANSHGAYVGADFITSEEPGYEDEDFRKEASLRSGRELNLKEASSYWYGEGLKFISNNPRQFAWLMYRKFIAFWHNIELSSNLNFYFARDFSYILRYDFVTFGFIVPFAIVGLILSRRKLGITFLLWAIPLSNFISTMIFFNASQYRLPVVPFFVLYFGFCLSEFYEKMVRKENVKLAGLILLVVIVFILVNKKDEILEKIPSRRLSYLNSATYYMKVHSYEKAENMLKKSLEIDPKYSLAYQKYAMFLRETGREEEAMKFLSDAMQYAAPGDKRLRNAFSDEDNAVLLYSKKNYRGALEKFNEILSKSPEREKELKNNIGLCYLKLNDLENARAEFLNAVKIDENYDKAYYNLGVLYEKSGDRKKAVEYFKKTLSINPSYEKAKNKLSAYEKIK